MKKAVGLILIAIVAAIAIWAAAWPAVMGGLGKDIAAQHGHPFQPITPPPRLPIRLGTGGTGCQVTVQSTTFSTSDRIRLIADLAPGADAVKIDLFPIPYTAQVDGYPAVRDFGSTASCVSEDLPPLPVGSYQAWVRIGDSGAHNAAIDFRVDLP